MKLAYRIIEDHGVVGVGPNNFATAMQPYVTSEFIGDWIYTVHNKYLSVWAETGIGGLIAFVTFLLVTVRRGWQCWRAFDPLLSPIALGLTAGIVGHMVHMSVDLFNGRPQVEELWLLAALITAIHCMQMEKRPSLRQG